MKVSSKSHHAPRRKVWALFVVLSVPQEAIKSPYSVWDQVVGLKEIEVLDNVSLDGLIHHGQCIGEVHRGRRRRLHPHPGPSFPLQTPL